MSCSFKRCMVVRATCLLLDATFLITFSVDPNHLLCGPLCPSKAAAGVLTIVHPRLRRRYGDCWSMGTIHQGRATVVDLVDYREGSDVVGGRHDPLSLCRLHVVLAWTVGETRGFLGSLRSALPCDSGSVVLLLVTLFLLVVKDD